MGMTMRRLYRSTTDRKVAGICGGLAEFWDYDPTIIRLAAVLLALVTVLLPFVITYVIGWMIIPEGANQNPQVKDAPRT